ncbi:flagellar basal body-associated protein FliL [Vibrio astriarenae]|uniref:Flagellar protein FliL n=1 Tax=Vibrio astriarenae TaxID=1481923 RepID=A0A7Z2YCE1_9VIBR|nr:flagellar basal body-associated protein FliL [Vibrio astriarenae]QIA62193.1 flagellar basal body-associated protein FliL [Vibrio astriarenae]
MYKRYVTQTLIGLCVILAIPAFAEQEAKPQLAYFTLSPDLTTNFHTSGKKLGYIQVRIDVMVANQSDLPVIELHQPLIRDAVIEMLGRQSEDTIKSLAGREELRRSLVDQINDTLLPETGRKVVADLLFTKYLYQ